MGDPAGDPFDLGLEGKVAIVTGGGSRGEGIGNGRAAAILLARAGARVLVADLDLAAAEQTVALAAEEGGEAAACSVDVTQEEQCEAMVRAALDRWGRLDVLDNNVGIGSQGSVVEETRESWERVLTINLTSMMLVSRHAIPAMVKSGGGAIVNIASIAAMRPRGLTAYSTSKGAIISLTRALAVDHGPSGIRVNCVAPGPAYTPMVEAWGLSDEARERRRKASVIDIEGTGWDVGNAVVFLASERARWITGQTLVVDGGVTLLARDRRTSGELEGPIDRAAQG
ncbi:MAG: SDR family oxidoreductase [Actinomycetia bacterium]|nr:SDR family oxidoreductase [Actinomycetes bacterium]